MLLFERKLSRGFALALALAGAALAVAGCRPAPEPEPVPAAEAASVGAVRARPVTMSVEAESAVAPGGTLTVLWRLLPATDWHLYWSGRNDSGFAPRVKLDLPAGWSAGPLQWPTPERLVSPGDILDHVYHGELVLLQEITAAVDAAPGRNVILRAEWQWLACRDSCVPGRDTLGVSLDVVATVPATAPSPALVEARARLPRPLPPDLVRLAWDGATLSIHGEGPTDGAAAGRLTFMPADDCGDLADLLHDGVGPSLALRLIPRDGRVGPVRGLLVLKDAAGPGRAFVIDVPAVPSTADPAHESAAGG